MLVIKYMKMLIFNIFKFISILFCVSACATQKKNSGYCGRLEKVLEENIAVQNYFIYWVDDNLSEILASEKYYLRTTVSP